MWMNSTQYCLWESPAGFNHTLLLNAIEEWLLHLFCIKPSHRLHAKVGQNPTFYFYFLRKHICFDPNVISANFSLQVQEQVHPTLKAQHSALEYIEDLILRLLAILCAAQPHSTQDVADRVKAAFPHPIDRWATMEAANATDKSKKKSPLVLPVDKIHPLLTKVGFFTGLLVFIFFLPKFDYKLILSDLLHYIMFVVVHFDALAQASDFQVESRSVPKKLS